MTAQQAASKFGKSVSTIYRWIKSGLLYAVKVGRKWSIMMTRTAYIMLNTSGGWPAVDGYDGDCGEGSKDFTALVNAARKSAPGAEYENAILGKYSIKDEVFDSAKGWLDSTKFRPGTEPSKSHRITIEWEKW